MGKFFKWLGITIIIGVATLGVGLIIWGVIALIKKMRDS